jgi:hypothetical protein
MAALEPPSAVALESSCYIPKWVAVDPVLSRDQLTPRLVTGRHPSERGGRHPSERLVAFNRNRWSPSAGAGDLRSWPPSLGHVFRDHGLADINPELEQFAVNPGCSG